MAPADDDTKNTESADEPKRPTPTIELAAETVEDEPEKPAAESATGHDESVKEAPELPPPAAKRSKTGGFLSHMAAGLLGGAIGVGAALFGLDRLPAVLLSTGAPAATGNGAGVAALRQEFEGLKTDIETASKAQAERFEKLEARAGEGGPAGDRAAAGELATRIEALEKALAAAGGAETGGDEASLKTEIEAIKSASEAAKTQSEDLLRQLTELREQVAQAGESEGQDGAASQAVAAKVNEIETRVGALQERQERAEKESKLAARAMAVAELERAAASGKAYAGQLDTLTSLLPATEPGQGPRLATLQSHALTGVMTQAALKESFPDYRRAALDAAAAPQSDALLDQITSRARSLVRVRPAGPQEGSTPGAVLSRVEAQLKDQNLAKALEELKGLTGAVAEAMAPWREAVEARLAIDREVDGLRRQLLGEIASVRPQSDG